MITVEEALRLLADATAPLKAIELPLDRARGCVLAETVVADRDFPPTDRSAMDGFAVRSADQELHVGPGQAARIMTGAIVPPGADAVVMVELTREQDGGGRVCVDDEPPPGQHIRRRGEDLERGRTAMEPGAPIHAAEIAALASVGHTSVRVHRPPVVHVLTTGDEIVDPDCVPGNHQVRNSSARALLAQLAEHGIDGLDLGVAGDERGELDRVLRRGLEADVLLITGGVSAGKYDLVGDALAAAGMRTLFHRVAVKPGKPLLAGRRGDCLVLGLPGNPVSTFTSFALFVAPALRRLLGYRRWENRRRLAVLAEPLRERGERETYHLARLEWGPDGLTARSVSSPGSGDVLALARANGFIVTPLGGASHAAGSTVAALSWQDFDFR
jgi:molybdopterin molybdotransferase